ncbi:MAG TPA: C39 family peptidase, partial [Bacteroidota bacterium]
TDRLAPMFIPTDFIYQYRVDPQIGGSICSPTSVSILRSYSIPVVPLLFARDTYDPYYDMFGIWPRVVQNASEYGLDGAVTRYRSWSQAREVLARGGRIALSVGLPLYSGHLMMLAGFTAAGDPIVHDPARSDGYSHLFSKSDLSHSWFDKGGVAYTFYQAGTGPTDVPQPPAPETIAQGFRLGQNYPNPFNPTTHIEYQLATKGMVTLVVYDVLGRAVRVLVNEEKMPGRFELEFDGTGLASGAYIYRLTADRFVESRTMFMVK